MTPGLAVDNISDGLGVNAVLGGQGRQGLSCGMAKSNLLHRLVGEFGRPSIFPRRHAPAVGGLLHVFCVIPQAQMCGLNADGAVAGVQDMASGRDRTVVDAVGGLVRFDVPAIDPEMSVTTTGCTYPIPAPFCGGFTGHELGERYGLGQSGWALFSSASKGVTMSLPAKVVGLAPSSGHDFGGTVFDRAGHLLSLAQSEQYDYWQE